MRVKLKVIIALMRAFLGFMLFLSSAQLFPLDPEKPVDQYMVDQWQTADGLPSASIISIAQTPDGYLWIATNKGLVRFDGVHFSIISFAGKMSIALEETTIPDTLFVDREGIMWIGSAERVTSYRYTTGRFKSYTAADGITRDRIRRISADMKGNLWISFYSSYVNRFNNGKFTAFNRAHGLEGKKINSIVEDSKGNLLFASREKGIFIFNEGKFSPFTIKDIEKVNIITLYEDRDSILWIGTNNGLFRLEDRDCQKYGLSDGLSNDYIISLIEDGDGNIWAGTLKGLNRIKKRRKKEIEVKTILNRTIITSLFEDREKSLWIGTYNSGVKRLKEGKFEPFLPDRLEQENIFFSLYENNEHDILVGAHGGKLIHYQGKKFIEKIQIPGVTGEAITSIAGELKRELWLGTNGKGVFRLKGREFNRITTEEGLCDDLVSSIFRDRQGNLWFSTFDGVSVRRFHTGIIQSLNSQNGLLGKRVHNVTEDRNQNIWIASDNGVTVLKKGSLAKEKISYYLEGSSVTCIHQDQDSTNDFFWLGTHGSGLKRLDLKTKQVVSFTSDQGMVTNFIYQFFEDQQENLWLMSNNGILRVSKRELNRFAIEFRGQINCTSFGISDGLKSLEFNNEFSRSSAMKTKSGELWFITKKGISIVNPTKVRVNKTPPPVVIESALFNKRPVPRYLGTKKFKGIKEIRFGFTAPTFLSPEKIKFNYRLEGVDEEWVTLPPGSRREAYYKNLKPGTYTFRVTACNAEGVWNRTGVALSFSLQPFFYETIEFKIATLLLLTGVLIGIRFFYKKLFPNGLFKFKKQVPDSQKNKETMRVGEQFINSEDMPKEKYRYSRLAPQFVEECIKKLDHLMKIEKIYREADLTLPSLAKKLSVTTHILSQILNEHLNRNFSDFINYYRIEEAKEILGGPKGARKKIANVAFDVGFNTIVAFYTAFKKYTLMTPARYKKEAHQRKGDLN